MRRHLCRGFDIDFIEARGYVGFIDLGKKLYGSGYAPSVKLPVVLVTPSVYVRDLTLGWELEVCVKFPCYNLDQK